ncbi:MAG TPA: gamma-glutamyl-gamma-aminobutyrate hydrolase family protein [Gemmatimonadaceae bacterium]|nr:gamma-glutamyl-gamma-aminobutyrate hydrolase family protein [Gemmatimonadaceae bacterium]
MTATTEIIRGLPRVRLNEAYTNALAAAGLIPLVLPPMARPDFLLPVLERVQGLVLTGGEDLDPATFGQAPHPATGAPHAARDATEIALAREARTRRIPTLAICRGAQVMNVALGGTLVQDIPSQHPSDVSHDQSERRTERVHRTDVAHDSLLARTVGATRLSTNSSHHQSVDRVAEGLRVVARAEDGIIEAIEPADASWWMLAVQWHPEELTATAEDWDRRLFAEFARVVAAQENN